jgi:hypothetical protein
VTLADPHLPDTRSRNADRAATEPAEPRSWASAAEDALRAPALAMRQGGGEKLGMFRDRVRGRPAVTPAVSMMLGQNAAVLGVWGLFFPHSVNRFLGMNASSAKIRLLFGAREMATATLAADPTRADVLWARVAGDAFDIAALRRLDTPLNPKRRNVRLALGVVLAVTALDVLAAVRMSTVKRNCETGARA